MRTGLRRPLARSPLRAISPRCSRPSTSGATLCGRTLARAHARTGDPQMITGYVGKSEVLDEALAAFAMSYASQTVLDHAKLSASALVPPAPAPQEKQAA